MKSSNIRGRLLVVLAVGVASSADARAHLANTGFGPFYDGMYHLVLAPEDLLPVIALALLGVATAVFVLFSLVSGLVVRLEALWARTAVRVAGSWIAAVGLLMLGWAFGGRQ